MSEITRTLRPTGHFFSLSSPSFLLNLHPPRQPSFPHHHHHHHPPPNPPLAELGSVKRLRETYDFALRAKRGKVGAEEVDPVLAGFLGAGESGEALGRVIKLGGGRLRVGGEGKVGLPLGACVGEGESRCWIFGR